jgi:hypothetical protein
MNKPELTENAIKVLKINDLGSWTQPASGLYPHQWLWDSCFISIGLRHTDTERAKEEIRCLLKGQWSNGMIPNIIFSKAKGYHAGPWLWWSWWSWIMPNSPKKVQTSGITQPPVLAEAVVRIGQKLSPDERKTWYKEVFPAIVDYHEWLYRDRDPHQTGLVTVVHPWESGLDNTPPWMEMLHRYSSSLYMRVFGKLGVLKFVDKFRADTTHVPAEERMSTEDLYSVYKIVRQLRRYRYNDKKILKNQKVLLRDLAFNSILIRANDLLADIAHELDEPLPALLQAAHQRSTSALESFWNASSKEYYSIDANTNDQIQAESIATFLPLYAGELDTDRVEHLLNKLNDPKLYSAKFSVPSTSLSSSYFKPHCYWQGPVWINMNWMIIDGLRRNNQPEIAEKLKKQTIELVALSGMDEYFSPLDGSPAGISNFSWTASLTLDLLQED